MGIGWSNRGFYGSAGKDSACNAGDTGLGRSPGGGNGNPLQYPCLENPMDRGAKTHSQKSQRGLTELNTHTHTLVTKQPQTPTQRNSQALVNYCFSHFLSQPCLFRKHSLLWHINCHERWCLGGLGKCHSIYLDLLEFPLLSLLLCKCRDPAFD